jgi:hypothetical protein
VPGISGIRFGSQIDISAAASSIPIADSKPSKSSSFSSYSSNTKTATATASSSSTKKSKKGGDAAILKAAPSPSLPISEEVLSYVHKQVSLLVLITMLISMIIVITFVDTVKQSNSAATGVTSSATGDCCW